jgi:two-component system, OmpR family, response regulator ChvI
MNRRPMTSQDPHFTTAPLRSAAIRDDSLPKVVPDAAQSSRTDRVLIVDDQTDITSVLKIGLQRYGFRVDAYNDPERVVKEFEANIYGAALVDIRMPGMNGFELYRRIKKVDPDLKVCFFTAFEIYDKEMEQMFPEIKPAAIFKKPMDIRNLASRLRSVMAGSGEGPSRP